MLEGVAVAFGLDPATRLVATLLYFVEDSVKILALLFVLIAAIGFARSFISAARVKRALSGNKAAAHLSAALFGALTPFCSCSSIPLFLGFLEAGAPLGPALSFLITSPLINEYLVVLMAALFGLKIAALYVAAGLALGILGGWLLGLMHLEKHLVPDLVAAKAKERAFRSWKERARYGLDEAKSITGKLWPWVLVGVALGAVIHNYVPQAFIASLVATTGVFGVPLAVLLGVPMYGSGAALVPIAMELFQKGVPLGSAMAFLMAVTALSLPEAIILRRAMKLKLIGIFFLATAIGIAAIGFLFNLL